MPQRERIRLAKEKDIPIMGDIIAESWKTAYRGIVEDAYLDELRGERWGDFLREGMENGALTCLLLLCEEQAVGVSVARASRFTAYLGDAELVSLYLLPSYMGKGLGGKLLLSAMNEMRRQGYVHCVLDVLCENARAISFYERKGLYKTGEQIEAVLGEQKLPCHIMRGKL
ncbi:MAG TPA: N-acetyltransferase [Clostridiales bacterium]|nr:N-acetyltransferase [Clostridiales bacterium]